MAHDADLFGATSAIIDGKIVVPGEGGKTDFATLQNSLTGKADNLLIVAFDLLYLDGRDLRRLPLITRKAALKQLLAGTPIEYSDHFRHGRRRAVSPRLRRRARGRGLQNRGLALWRRARQLLGS